MGREIVFTLVGTIGEYIHGLVGCLFIMEVLSLACHNHQNIVIMFKVGSLKLWLFICSTSSPSFPFFLFVRRFF